MKTILSFLAAGFTFSVLDYIWLAHIAKKFYLEKLALLVTIKDGSLVVNYFGAAAFYALALAATYIFAVRTSTAVSNAFLNGAMLGFFMYAFYDMTNYATLKNWSLQLSILDILWGTLLMGCVACVMYFVKSF